MNRKLFSALGFAVVIAGVACITINVYFPEAAVKDLSEQIEDEVARKAAGEEEATPTPSPSPTPPTSVNDDLLSLVFSLGASTAWAGEEVPSPEISNPAIRKLIDSRAARLPEINQLKKTGVIGENNRALLELRNLDSLASLKDRAMVQRLVKEENADREQLFKEIAAAENVDLSQIDRIRTTYAETIREKANPGDWLQLPDGTWQQKTRDQT